jgi:hypothetical protein
MGQNTFMRKFTLGENIITIEVTKVVNGPMSAVVYAGSEKNDDSPKFQFYKESYNVFRTSLKVAVNKVISEKNIYDNAIEAYSNEIYLELITFETSVSEVVPRAGYLWFTREVPVEPILIGRIPCRKQKKVDTLWHYSIQNIQQLSILDGKFKKLETTGQIEVPWTFSIPDNQKKVMSVQKRLLKDKMNRKNGRKELRKLITEIADTAVNKQFIQKLGVFTDKKQMQQSKRPIQDVAREVKDFVNNSRLIRPDTSIINLCIDQIVLEQKVEIRYNKMREKELIKEIIGAKTLKIRTDTLILLCGKIINANEEIQQLTQANEDITYWFKENLKQTLVAIEPASQPFVYQMRKFGNFYLGVKQLYDPAYNTYLAERKDFVYLMTIVNSSPDSMMLMIEQVRDIGIPLDKTLSGLEEQIDKNIRDMVRKNSFILKKRDVMADTNKADSVLMVRIDSVGKLLKITPDDTILLQLSKTLKERHEDMSASITRSETTIKDFKREVDSLKRATEEIEYSHKLCLDALNPVQIILGKSNEYSQKIREIKEIEKRKAQLKSDLVTWAKEPTIIVDSLHIEFNDGVLKNILVEGKYGSKQLFFTNSVPVQFTGITHLEKLNKIELEDMYQRAYKINLTRVMKYVPVLHVDAEDYTPSDSVYDFILSADKANIQLASKEKQSQILEARAFSDLIGLTAGQPNGLIQFEVCKKIPLFTHRIKYCKNFRSFISFGSYYYPQFTLSKLEQDNKYYYTDNIEINSGKGTISTLDIYKYASMQMKLINLNLFNWEIAEIKSAVEVNGGFTLLYTPVRDSITKPGTTSQWGTISGMPFTGLNFLIKPDVRYGFSLSGELGWVFNWDDKLLQINNPADPGSSKSYSRLLFNFQFNTFYKPFKRSESAVFFRVANVHSWPFKATYLQVQLGYAFNIFKNSGSK